MRISKDFYWNSYHNEDNEINIMRKHCIEIQVNYITT